MRGFAGRVSAVTGAASGIGRALAVELADLGSHLALADVDEVGLAETAGACAGSGVKVTTAGVDVADRHAVFSWADQVFEEHGRVDLVVNNAGVALAAEIATMAVEDLEWVMGVNFFGVLYGTKAFLPYLLERGEGHVVNMSSVFGLVGIPYQSAYNASKFAVRGFTDALRMELEAGRTGVSCTAVFPGGVKTNIARHAKVDAGFAALAGGRDEFVKRFDKVAMTRPDTAARRILRSVERDERHLLIGPEARLFELFSRLPSGLYQRVVVAGARRRR